MPSFGFRHRAASLLVVLSVTALSPSVAQAARDPKSGDKGTTARDTHKPIVDGTGRKVG
jgi:hypothetical protein